MWQGFTIALREGIEAFLIVALTLAYLQRTGRPHLARAVYAAIAVSLVTCAAAGWLFSTAANQSLWEGILALVGSLLVYMKRMSKRLKSDIEQRIEARVTAQGEQNAFWGVFLFLLLWTMLCLSSIVRRPWVDQERVPFPIIELPVMMVQKNNAGALFSNRLLALGFALTSVLLSVNYLSSMYPSVPGIHLAERDIGTQFFVTPPWSSVSPILTVWWRRRRTSVNGGSARHINAALPAQAVPPAPGPTSRGARNASSPR